MEISTLSTLQLTETIASVLVILSLGFLESQDGGEMDNISHFHNKLGS